MDSTRWRPAFSSRSRPGATTKATSLRARPSCWRKRLAARSSALLTANPAPNRLKTSLVSPCLCLESSRLKTGLSPISTRTCWRSGASHRNRGLGEQLKWEQRREALSRGIRRMEWTFDPLVISNAFLNIHRLGAISRAYLVDFYGVSSSRLQGGLPTDRLLAEWELDSPRVEAILARRPAAAQSIQERILVPAPIDRWKASEASRPKALAVQLEIRQKFQAAFSRGLAVLGFSRDAEGNGVYRTGFPHPGGMKSWFYFFQGIRNFMRPTL